MNINIVTMFGWGDGAPNALVLDNHIRYSETDGRFYVEEKPVNV